jgi:hypothetical protein
VSQCSGHYSFQHLSLVLTLTMFAAQTLRDAADDENSIEVSVARHRSSLQVRISPRQN